MSGMSNSTVAPYGSWKSPIVADRVVSYTDVYTTTGANAKGGHPWQALDAREKVKVIADMLMLALREALPPLLAQK